MTAAASSARTGTRSSAAPPPTVAEAAVRSRPGMVPSVSRALALLDLLERERVPMGLARLATSLQLPKSSVHALCNTMLALGYLRRHGGGHFFIGPRVMPLADAFVSSTSVAQEFAALWDEAGAPPEETVILSVLHGADVVYLAARHGVRPLGLAFRVGMRLPAQLAATGKAMLAYQPVAAVRDLYGLYGDGLLPAPARGAAQSVDQLLHELERVRARGYSIDDEGVREGVHCIGAPVFDSSGAAVAGVGVCINKAAVNAATRERHRQTVMHAARLLSQRLGGSFPSVRE